MEVAKKRGGKNVPSRRGQACNSDIGQVWPQSDKEWLWNKSSVKYVMKRKFWKSTWPSLIVYHIERNRSSLIESRDKNHLLSLIDE